MPPSPCLDDWSPWTPSALVPLLKDAPATWYVVGGWALDLWHGTQTRPHNDLEICVPRQDLFAMRNAFIRFEQWSAHAGVVTPLSPEGRPADEVSQIWIRDPDTSQWKLDVMLESGTEDTWVYKRNSRFTLPREDALHSSPDGIRYLAPELVLLFKAKHLRAKDVTDFARACTKLSARQRDHLRMWLESAHPDHVWIDALM